MLDACVQRVQIRLEASRLRNAVTNGTSHPRLADEVEPAAYFTSPIITHSSLKCACLMDFLAGLPSASMGKAFLFKW
jgi:hypothetical protein